MNSLHTVSEVIREGLTLLRQREEQRQAMTEDLRSELIVGARQLDAGKSLSFDTPLVDKIKKNGKHKQGY